MRRNRTVRLRGCHGWHLDTTTLVHICPQSYKVSSSAAPNPYNISSSIFQFKHLGAYDFWFAPYGSTAFYHMVDVAVQLLFLVITCWSRHVVSRETAIRPYPARHLEFLIGLNPFVLAADDLWTRKTKHGSRGKTKRQNITPLGRVVPYPAETLSSTDGR